MSLPGEIIQGILARAALAVLRVYLGVVFLLGGLPKLQRDTSAELKGFLEQVAVVSGHEFYRPFVERVLLPNVVPTALFLGWAEVLVGIALIAGLLTRFCAAVALVLTLNYMFARGAWFWTPWSYDGASFAIALALLIGAAGRTLGVDAWLARRWPRSPLW